MARSASPLPAPLARAAQRLEEWRSHRTGRGIPGDLWAMAADLAGRYGVSRTSRALRLPYYGLKERVEGASAPAPDRTDSSPVFVEILTTPSPVAAECLVEFESPAGAKMRIHVNATGSLHLAELTRLFLEARP